ncbi:MAG: hypothetical protein KN64_07195 [Sulfurovum sp. AS07-7]|nr:MAG: hypothetical protein KN64_07195 [Sulfurovum sp. AS07-7]
MKLEELKAREIIISVLGERGTLKSEDELSQILKKRLTKKERFALNAKVTNADMQNTLEALNADVDRYEAIIAGAVKKMKNESVHKEFYNLI